MGLRDIGRRSAWLGVLALASAGLLAYVMVQRVDANQQETQAMDDVQRNRAALVSVQRDAENVRQRLQELEAERASGFASLPTRERALALSTDLINYVAQHRLVASDFATSQSTEPLGGVEYPIANLTLEARGSKNSLVEMLGLLNSYPSAVVRDLDYTRLTGAEDLWVLRLSVGVVYERAPGGGT